MFAENSVRSRGAKPLFFAGKFRFFIKKRQSGRGDPAIKVEPRIRCVLKRVFEGAFFITQRYKREE